jgi:hypothetical protein
MQDPANELPRISLLRTRVNRVRAIIDSLAVHPYQGEETEAKWRSRSTPEVCLSLRHLIPLLGSRSVLIGLALSLFFARRSFCLGLTPLELFAVHWHADGDLSNGSFPFYAAGPFFWLGIRVNQVSSTTSGS